MGLNTMIAWWSFIGIDRNTKEYKNKAFCINYDQYSKAYKILQAV